MVTEFSVKLFGKEIFSDELIPEEKEQILHAIMMVIFSHRYNKEDRFILETNKALKEGKTRNPIDFTIVRDVMYKYSKKAQDRYLSYPV